MPVDAAVAAADWVHVLRGPMRLLKPPKGIRLVATEADWAHGEGPMVEAAPRPYWAVCSGWPGEGTVEI